MSKYDEAITAQKTAHTVRAFLMSATRRNEDGSDDPSNDKGIVRWELEYLPSGHNGATFALHAGFGTYGSSSFYPIKDAPTIRYLGKAATNLSRAIADEAIRLAEEDAKRLARESAMEAQRILDIARTEAW